MVFRSVEKLDNSLDNLRLITASQNIMNLKTSGRNTSGYKNISKSVDKRGNGCAAWKIDICANGKKIHKRFPCKEHDTTPPQNVIDCRDKLIKELHGEYARQSSESTNP